MYPEEASAVVSVAPLISPLHSLVKKSGFPQVHSPFGHLFARAASSTQGLAPNFGRCKTKTLPHEWPARSHTLLEDGFRSLGVPAARGLAGVPSGGVALIAPKPLTISYSDILGG